MKFSHTLSTKASPERLWHVWTDVANWKRWDYHLEYSKVNGKFREGATGIIKSGRAKETSFLIEKAKKYELTIAVELPLATLRINRHARKQRNMTEFTHETSFEGPMGFAYGIFFGARFRRELPVVMGKVRQLAERS
jgi:hypothetical protein